MAETCANANILEAEGFSRIEGADSTMITRIPETVIYLASCAVNEVKPDADKIAGIDFEKIISFASYHVMGAVVGMAIESAGVKNDHVKNAISFSVRKNTFLRRRIIQCLENLKKQEYGICR